MKRFDLLIFPLLSLGCAALTPDAAEDGAAAPRRGPKVTPDETEWRRQPVPLPPLYMDITTGSGDRWILVTPLYWQVVGPERRQHVLFPLASWRRDEAAHASSGHVLLWLWRSAPGDRTSWKTLFPLFWDFESGEAKTSLYGPLYVRQSFTGNQRSRAILLPWIYSRERDDTGYSYWGVFFRLLGYERQFFNAEERRRLWLFFVFRLAV